MTLRPLLLLILTVCSATAQTTIDATMQHDGLSRSYRLYIPAAYNASQPVPLVFNLHGYTSNNVQQEFYGDFRPIADTANFIIVHPNGTLDNGGQRFWNAFGTSTVDDLGFLSALIDVIQEEYAIDLDRVYSTGMSNGGFMSYQLACQLGHRITAVASVTGSMMQALFNACNATHPTPIMQIHGTADPTVPYIGNVQGMMHIDTLVKRWAQFNNCDPVPTVTPVPNTNLFDGSTAEHKVYGNGTQGATAELFKVIGGAHTWPGASITLGVTNQDFSASVEIWKFFRRYRMSELVTGMGDEAEPTPAFTIFPNPSEGIFTLRFPDAGPRTVTVTNVMGQRVASFATSAPELQIELSASGIYLVRSEGYDGGTRTQRVMVR